VAGPAQVTTPRSESQSPVTFAVAGVGEGARSAFRNGRLTTFCRFSGLFQDV